MGERSDFGHDAEVLNEEELIELENEEELIELERLISIVERIDAITAWLIEAGPGTDPQIVAAKRVQRSRLLARLGLDPQDEGSLQIAHEMANEATSKLRARVKN